MTDFLQRVDQNTLNRQLLKRGQMILVAVSGGLDSMTLLHALHKISARHKWKMMVAHFNHQLRGRSSDADEKLVRKMAAAMKLPFIAGCADVKEFARKSKLSTEMAARKMRHEFFAQVARKHKIKAIALAHHADDQVELFFLRLLRGAGGEGLAGMKWRSPSPVDKNLALVRPLLGFSKFQIEKFARENKIRFRGDATNFSPDFLRNRVRHELLPLLQKNYQPGLAKTVLRLMEIVGAESELAAVTARQWLVERRPAFEKLPVAIQRLVLQSQLTRQKAAVDFELIEQLRESRDKFVCISPALSVSRDARGDLKWRPQILAAFPARKMVIKLTGRAAKVIFDGTNLNWRFDSGGKLKLPQRKIGREFFDADKVGDEILLRHWRAGDRFQPIGFETPAKLQDLFTNAKIPRGRRHDLILAATAAGKIFWVEDLRISENFKLTPLTRRRLVWNWRRIER